ncbi:putative lactoylglutathione lyase [Variovorax sp. 3319]|nr:putative lactoylglutathione lyase [Variovorax sp. 3319]
MTKSIFVNLPVADLPRSKAFYEALGFNNTPQFTDDTAACMVWSESICVMLLTIRNGAASPAARFPPRARAR